MDDENEVSDDDVDDSTWVLIPLSALMIPILAVSDGTAAGGAIQVAVAVSLIMAVGAVLARMLLVIGPAGQLRLSRSRRLLGDT